MNRQKIMHIFLISMCVILAPISAAYVGPGAGLSAIGGALALIGAVFLGVIGFFWYPIKRLMRRFKARNS